MNKVQLEIIGLSYSQTQSGAYVLLLSEREGVRKLPIIIGSYEAQAIAIELERMIPNRPLTHDLFKNIANSFKIGLKEVLIDELNEGIFHAKLMFEQNGETIAIDARTSDAIAIAVRFKCPIYAFDKIMDSAGILMDETAELDTTQEQALAESTQAEPQVTLEQLHEQLAKALENENYELASKIRDEINRRSAH
ncbi:MAG TPA: DUF151 domain-containing protein [Crocinitomicaceae bacterium]|nr:DUF151 domain-containing protein [Crocinitomicaceae bacterium]